MGIEQTLVQTLIHYTITELSLHENMYQRYKPRE